MKLLVLKATEVVFEGEVESVLLPTKAGKVKILPGHTSLATLLFPGVVKILGGSELKKLQVERGLVSVEKDTITLLLDQTANNFEASKILNFALELARSGQDGRNLPHELIEVEKEIKYQLNKREFEETF
ncbi:MAG: hypothetical protein AAB443_00690 [Patescibacteria group bacterium]